MGKQQGLTSPCGHTARCCGRPYGRKISRQSIPTFPFHPSTHPSIHKNIQTITQSKSHLLLKGVHGELDQSFDGVLHEEHRINASKKEVVSRQDANAYQRLQQGRRQRPEDGRMGSIDRAAQKDGRGGLRETTNNEARLAKLPACQARQGQQQRVFHY